MRKQPIIPMYNPPMERIQKFLASRGAGSRRQIDSLLQQGRISVNGKPAKPGDQVEGREKFAIDGKPLRLQRHAARPKIMLYHKPVGQVCTRDDPEGRETVFEHLPGLREGRWVGIGRLDINTSGLLLFTSDGELANRLMHPSFEVEREYAVRVRGEVSAEMLQQLREGRNREVRRLWEAVGVEVSRLVRVRYEQFTLPRWLKPGKYRYLDDDAVARVYRRLGLGAREGARRKTARGRRKSR